MATAVGQHRAGVVGDRQGSALAAGGELAGGRVDQRRSLPAPGVPLHRRAPEGLASPVTSLAVHLGPHPGGYPGPRRARPSAAL